MIGATGLLLSQQSYNHLHTKELCIITLRAAPLPQLPSVQHDKSQLLLSTKPTCSRYQFNPERDSERPEEDKSNLVHQDDHRLSLLNLPPWHWGGGWGDGCYFTCT